METSDKLAFFALGISIMTAIFSWYSFSKTNELSKNAFNRNYRPYVSALNFSYINDDNLMTPDMNTLLIRILNAPAFVTSKKLTFYTRDNNGDSLFFEHPEYKNELLYPLDNTQNTMGTGNKIISQEICEKILPKKLIRKFRIEYEWISDSSLKYYFESEWEYSVVKRNWQVVSQTAN
ncbi:hypothetical protein G1K75_12375 [Tenacibaculum finnmarkense]|uniref:hypothetical protein n=1 Tax=Tenacibaculum finnmarkense TaxID=2781243 RepID=UPI001EFA8526|nr:hypothetical protein [Tenacibaculum finnmarkense]MCG8806447.1 hypothetical protein [Tenacibaculum finnmarkense]MCG8857562.1 hypothetical protein [Tenacibaculum finnmarkense]